jgi:hypothetical protein
MTDPATNSEENRIKAAELYEEGRKLEAQQDYIGAMKSYEQSLNLYEDPLVETAYFKMLATIGPE